MILKFTWKKTTMQEPSGNSQKKRNYEEGLALLGVKTYYKVSTIKAVVLAQTYVDKYTSGIK